MVHRQDGDDLREGALLQGTEVDKRRKILGETKPGSTADLMKSIEERLAEYALSDDAGCVVINSEQKLFKPNPSGFERLIAAVRKEYGNERFEFTYIGDNLEKDFIWPNAHGWNTVCLLDDGRNIHKQDFASVSGDALPKQVVSSLVELI